MSLRTRPNGENGDSAGNFIGIHHFQGNAMKPTNNIQ